MLEAQPPTSMAAVRWGVGLLLLGSLALAAAVEFDMV